VNYFTLDLSKLCHQDEKTNLIYEITYKTIYTLIYNMIFRNYFFVKLQFFSWEAIPAFRRRWALSGPCLRHYCCLWKKWKKSFFNMQNDLYSRHRLMWSLWARPYRITIANNNINQTSILHWTRPLPIWPNLQKTT